MHASTAALSSVRDCGVNTAAVALVEVEICALVNMVIAPVAMVEVEVCALVDMVIGAVVVEVDTVCALVDIHTFDIDPNDPTNIWTLLACEWTHAAPQSGRAKDVAP